MTNADSSLQTVLETALRHSQAHLESLDKTSVASTTDLATLRRQLPKPLQNESRDPSDVLNELVRDVQGGILGSAGARFFAWVIGGVLPAALGADWLTSAWDQNAGLYACAPAAAIVEEAAGCWLKELLKLPADASFALTTGCQMAHVTCLAAARHALLSDRQWNVEQRGLHGAPQIEILSSVERHHSIDRAVRLLGFGTDHITSLPVDTQGMISDESLDRALSENDGRPALVVLQAGDVNTGAYDRFKTLVPIAHKHRAWVHVDGAFGLWAAASPTYEHLTDGLSQADSWATDGHKWLNVPYDCGYAFIAHPQPHRSSMSLRAPYLIHDVSARDQIDWNPEFSRRARGFPTYAAIRQLGRSGIANLVDRCCEHARSLTSGIGQLRGAEVIATPIINQGLVRFPDPRHGASEEDHARRTDKVIADVLSTGEAFFGATTWRGKRVMRISVCNWQTSACDVERVVNAVAKVLES